MFSLTVTTDKDETAVVINGLAAALAKPETLMPPLAVALQREVATIFREQSDPVTGVRWAPTGSLALSTRVGGGQSGKTLSDTGNLRNALVSARPKIVDNQVSVDTSGVPYAALHNFGGVQRPRNAKSLAIPLTKEAKRAGSARRWWGQNVAKKPFIFNNGEKVFIDSLADIKGNKKGDKEGPQNIVLQFILLKFVRIPQRRFIGVSPRLVRNSVKIAQAVVAKIIADSKRKA